MKLYTENQVEQMLRNFFEEEEIKLYLKEFYTPIELPSELTALNEHLEWLKKELQRVIEDGESESWVYAYKRAIKNAESLIEKYKNEQQ